MESIDNSIVGNQFFLLNKIVTNAIMFGTQGIELQNIKQAITSSCYFEDN